MRHLGWRRGTCGCTWDEGGEAFRARVGSANSIEELSEVAAAVRRAGVVRNESTWYRRHRTAAVKRVEKVAVDVMAEGDDVMGGLFGD